MTNEEILEFAKRATAELKEPREIDYLDHEAVAGIIREVVQTAFEEAAKAAEWHYNKCANDDRFYCTLELAKEIRALFPVTS